jgi:hypothetical protein
MKANCPWTTESRSPSALEERRRRCGRVERSESEAERGALGVHARERPLAEGRGRCEAATTTVAMALAEKARFGLGRSGDACCPEPVMRE